MSNRERIISLLDDVPEYKMGYVLAFIEGLIADEETDDIFCERLAEQWENDASPDKHDFITLEEFAKEVGINLNENEGQLALMDKFIDLQRIKTALDREKEIEYQLKTTKAKLEVLGVVTTELTMEP